MFLLLSLGGANERALADLCSRVSGLSVQYQNEDAHMRQQAVHVRDQIGILKGLGEMDHQPALPALLTLKELGRQENCRVMAAIGNWHRAAAAAPDVEHQLGELPRPYSLWHHPVHRLHTGLQQLLQVFRNNPAIAETFAQSVPMDDKTIQYVLKHANLTGSHITLGDLAFITQLVRYTHADFNAANAFFPGVGYEQILSHPGCFAGFISEVTNGICSHADSDEAVTGPLFQDLSQGLRQRPGARAVLSSWPDWWRRVFYFLVDELDLRPVYAEHGYHLPTG